MRTTLILNDSLVNFLATKLSLVADVYEALLRLSRQAELDRQALPSGAW